MRNDFMRGFEKLDAMQMPEKPAPTIRTSTVVTEEFEEEAADSVMRGPPLLCSFHGRNVGARTLRFPGAIDALRESSVDKLPGVGNNRPDLQFDRTPSRGRVRRGASSHRGGLHLRLREAKAAEGPRDRRRGGTQEDCRIGVGRGSSAQSGNRSR